MPQKFATLSDNDKVLVQKPQAQCENVELLDQKPKGLKSQGQSRNDELLS